ncbi:sugar phosphate isomerase/epimerase family protein [Bacteroidota bacterium]
MTILKNRRTFIKQAAIASTVAFVPGKITGCMSSKSNRKFKMSLNPGAIGVRLNQEELLEAAVNYGFEAIVPFSRELVEWSDEQLKEFVSKMKSQNITWGAAGLPLNFRKDEATHKEGIEQLPKHAATLQKAGVTRMSTWIMPTHPELTYLQNFKQHSERLREVCKIIGDHGIRFGMEYVGPKTLMASQKFPFVHTMAECKELMEGIGEPNAGVQLDSFHWFCAGETKEDLLSLTKEQIATVDLNDATAGRTADEQLDGERELPMASGLVDMQSFMDAMVEIGYDGPMRAEPFNQPLRDMEDDDALKTTFNAMSTAFALVDK